MKVLFLLALSLGSAAGLVPASRCAAARPVSRLHSTTAAAATTTSVDGGGGGDGDGRAALWAARWWPAGFVATMPARPTAQRLLGARWSELGNLIERRRGKRSPGGRALAITSPSPRGRRPRATRRLLEQPKHRNVAPPRLHQEDDDRAPRASSSNNPSIVTWREPVEFGGAWRAALDRCPHRLVRLSEVRTRLRDNANVKLRFIVESRHTNVTSSVLFIVASVLFIVEAHEHGIDMCVFTQVYIPSSRERSTNEYTIEPRDIHKTMMASRSKRPPRFPTQSHACCPRRSGARAARRGACARPTARSSARAWIDRWSDDRVTE